MPAVVSSQIKRLAGKPADAVVDAASGSVLAALAGVTDPRSRFGRHYPLAAVLALAVCAVTCDANGFTAIAQWASDLSEEQLMRFGLVRGRYTGRIRVPSERTFRTVLSAVDPGELLDAVGRYVTHRLERAGMAKIPGRIAKEREARRRAKAAAARREGGLRVLAADGKTLRGSGRTRHQRTHLVAVVDQDSGRVGARINVPGKTNETPALRAYVQTIDLDEAVLTAELRAAPATGVEFPGAAQVMLTQRHRRPIGAGGRESRQLVYAITSLTPEQAGPPVLAEIEQKHWTCEARHHILDVTFGEDHCQARTGHAPENLSTLRDLAIDAFRAAGHVNLAHARRHHTHDPERVLDLYEL